MFDSIIARVKHIIADVKAEFVSPSFEDAAHALEDVAGLLRDGRDLFNAWFGTNMRALPPMKLENALSIAEKAVAEGEKGMRGTGDTKAIDPTVLQAIMTLILNLISRFFPSMVIG